MNICTDFDGPILEQVHVPVEQMDDWGDSECYACFWLDGLTPREYYRCNSPKEFYEIHGYNYDGTPITK